MPRPKSEDVKGKPPFSYVFLAMLAIGNKPDRRAKLSEIYKFIIDNFEYYRVSNSKWQNSLRHSLSFNDCFQRESKGQGRGCYWTIHPESVTMFFNGSCQRRKKRFKIDSEKKESGYGYHELQREVSKLLKYNNDYNVNIPVEPLFNCFASHMLPNVMQSSYPDSIIPLHVPYNYYHHTQTNPEYTDILYQNSNKVHQFEQQSSIPEYVPPPCSTLEIDVVGINNDDVPASPKKSPVKSKKNKFSIAHILSSGFSPKKKKKKCQPQQDPVNIQQKTSIASTQAELTDDCFTIEAAKQRQPPIQVVAPKPRRLVCQQISGQSPQSNPYSQSSHHISPNAHQISPKGQQFSPNGHGISPNSSHVSPNSLSILTHLSGNNTPPFFTSPDSNHNYYNNPYDAASYYHMQLNRTKPGMPPSPPLIFPDIEAQIQYYSTCMPSYPFVRKL